MKLNKKGFTLVELLAVIVILAVVMLVAITAIGPVMERANKGALSSSAQIILSGAENAYTADQMAAAAKRKFNNNKVCVSIKALEDAGYFDAKGKKYYGSVLIDSTTPSKVTYKLWVTDWDTSYYIDGKESKELGVDAVIENGTARNAVFINTFSSVATNGILTIGASDNHSAMYCGDTTYRGTVVGKLNA